jgi:hypothetical protein
VARGVGKSQAAEDLWHLSIGDLLAAPNDRASPAGSGPVVINLSTSTAHIGPPAAGMRHFDGLHLYQLRRGPEDQPQYLLRLGIITSDIEADAILSSVLEHYPGATKASAEDDDRAAIAARAQAAPRPPKAAPPPVPPANPAATLAAKPIAKRTEALRPTPKSVPATPVAVASPPEPIRWDIDELLPDLAVTRPPPPKPIAPEAPQPRAEQTTAPSVVEAQAPSPPVAEPAQTFEFTLAAPEPAAAPARADANEIEFSYDSDAITHEAPLPTFEFDVPDIAAPVPHEVHASLEEEPPTLEVHASPLEEPPTIEVQAAEAPTVELRAPDVIAIEVHDVETVSIEPPVPIAPAASIPAPIPDPAAETLEQRVAKIDAMVESVDQHEKERPEFALSAPEPADAPRIDSTQTLRALTALELADDQSSPWFSIQLVFSDEQIDPEQVPDLDLFNEYRLYSVAGLHEERIMHSLRLGFFSSELAAEAVAGYLRGFFDAPCIKRVSVAERERFAEQSMSARKDIGATGVHAVIELTSPKALPERQARVSSKGTNAAQSSIWSRLVAPLRR